MATIPEPIGEVDVLALIDHFAMGGAETVLARFAVAAPRAGINLKLVCIEPRGGGLPAAASLVDRGIPVTCLRQFDGRIRPADRMALRRLIKSSRPNLIHTHLNTSDLLGGVVGKELDVPTVSTIHTMQWDGRPMRIARTLVKHTADRIIAVSESARREYLAQGWARPEQIIAIHNGVDVSSASGSGHVIREEFGFSPDDQVVAMVSSLRPEKAHDVAVEAVRQLIPRYPRLRLLIIGEGSMRETIVRRRRGLEEHVVLAGARTDVMRVLDAADLFLHPSLHEALPTAIIEAMAASTPVVATAVGGIPEIITTPQVGALIPAPPRPEAIADAVSMLLGDSGRRAAIAAAARRAYEERFTAEPWVTRTRAVYDTVLSDRRGHGRSLAHRLTSLGVHDVA